MLLDVFLAIRNNESMKMLQFYFGELPFDIMHELIKWKFLTSYPVFQLDFIYVMS